METNNDLTDTSGIITLTPDPIQLGENSYFINTESATTCTTTVSDSTDNNFWQKDGQPSGWTQLLIAVGIPLFVVFLEKWVAKYYTKKKEKEEREKYRKTLIDWIRLITPIEKDLAKSLSDLAKSIEQSDDMQPERYAMPTTIPDKLSSLSVEQLMDAFLTDFNGDKGKCSCHIYNIISNLEFLSKARNEIVKFYDSYNKQSFSCCEQWNAEVYVFKEWNIHQRDDSIKQIIKVWAANLIVKKDSIQAHEKLVNNMLQLCSSDSNIAPTLIRMRDIILQRKALSNGYGTVFTDLSNNIILSLEQLSAACNFFKNNGGF